MAAEVTDSPVKGNWLARQLKLMNDSSRELFPTTPAEAKASKFHSIYAKDYHDYPKDIVLQGLGPKGQQRPQKETIRDVLFGYSPTSVSSPALTDTNAVTEAFLLSRPHQNQMFTNWKIPNRISKDIKDPQIPERVSAPEVKPSPVAAAVRPKPAQPVSASDVGRSQPLLPLRARSSHDPRATRMPASSQQQIKAVASQWQKRLPQVDRRLLERVVRIQQSENPQSGLRGSIQPDARRTVERWMESASEPEREVAVKFFVALAAGGLVGSDMAEQKTRLAEILRVLQRGDKRKPEQTRCPPPSPTASPTSPRKYVNLLDDETRRHRWMYTTWHHLPDYRVTNRVANSSSHYVTPHRPQHHHFVIHPDWPPV